MKKPSFFFRKPRGGDFFRITVNLDDHNRLINPLLTEVSNKVLAGERIFKASLNVMLPRYEKSIYVYNSHEFLSFCEKKANLYSLGVLFYSILYTLFIKKPQKIKKIM